MFALRQVQIITYFATSFFWFSHTNSFFLIIQVVFLTYFSMVNLNTLKVTIGSLALLALLQIVLYRHRNSIYTPSRPVDLTKQMAQLIMNNSSIGVRQNIFNIGSTNELDRFLQMLSLVSKEKQLMLLNEFQMELQVEAIPYSKAQSTLLYPTTSEKPLNIESDIVAGNTETGAHNFSSATKYSLTNQKHWRPDWFGQRDLYKVLINRRKLINER